MKAIVLTGFGSVDNFALVDLPDPQPKDNEVLIRIRATAFNPIDYQMRQGLNESKLLKSPVLGRELVGEVLQTGRSVTGFTVGDRVAAYVGSLGSNGTYAALISVPNQLIARIPASLSFEQAAAIPLAGMTALQSCNRFTASQAEAIFIAGGAGGVGTMVIKLLLAAGYTNLYTTAGNSQSIKHLKNLGLTDEQIIDYTKEDIVTTALARNGQAPFETVIELVGGRLSEVCAQLVEVFGTYVDVTALSTTAAREELFNKAATIVNVANYAPSLTGKVSHLDYYRNSLQELFDKIEQGILTPGEITVLGDLNVDTVQRAHRLLENNQTQGRKLIMRVG